MNPSQEIVRRCLAVAAALMGPALAAADQLDEARDLARDTVRLLKTAPDEALAAANRGAQREWGDAAARDVARFNLAWTHQQVAEGADNPRVRQERLESAARIYNELLQPDLRIATAVVENLSLVYTDLGLPARAAAVLERGLTFDLDPDARYRFLVSLGDSVAARDRQNGVPAWRNHAGASYQQALELLPDRPEARERLLNLATDGTAPPDEIERAARQSMEADLPSLASSGFRVIMSHKDSSEAQRLSALQGWLESGARTGSLNAASVSQLPQPKVWDHPAVDQVRSLLAAREGRSDISYWSENSLRRHLLADALKSLAHAARLRGRLVRSEELLLWALEVAPEPQQYGHDPLQGRPTVYLDIASDLASLYTTHRHTKGNGNEPLDGNGEKFRNLEQRLLNEKNSVYSHLTHGPAEQRSANLELIERFHITLALVYANPELDRWKSNGLASAPYHFERALQVAREIAGREAGEYQPLPHLTRVYADGMLEHAGNGAKARDLYLMAAQGYLDVDAWPESKNLLEKAGKVGTRFNLPVPDRQKALEGILKDRLDINRYDPQPKAEPNETSAYPVRFPTEARELDPTFVNRQHVRIMTDLSEKEFQSNNPQRGETYLKDAIENAKLSPGPTREDLDRLQRVPPRGGSLRVEIDREPPAKPNPRSPDRSRLPPKEVTESIRVQNKK